MKESVRKHHKYPSTPNFSTLLKEVRGLASDSEERFKFAGWHPDSGVPPTEEQKKLLSEFIPDAKELPILTFTGNEKLHGENCAVAYSNGELWVQSRNNIRTILGDQNDMAKEVEANRQVWLDMIEYINYKNDIDFTTHTVVLDCEHAGGKIQKNNAACSGTHNGFYIFDYCRIINNETEETVYASNEGLNPPNDKQIYLLNDFGTYNVTLDFSKPSECVEALEELALKIETNSPIAKYFNKPDNIGEGAVLTACYKNTLLKVKCKGEKHGGKPKEKKSTVGMTDELKIKLTELADKVTPVWRITQAIQETNATERKHFGELVKWILADIEKEEAPLLAEAGVDLKKLNGFVTTVVKDYYFASIKG